MLESHSSVVTTPMNQNTMERTINFGPCILSEKSWWLALGYLVFWVCCCVEVVACGSEGNLESMRVEIRGRLESNLPRRIDGHGISSHSKLPSKLLSH
jgi:hypothetical protein